MDILVERIRVGVLVANCYVVHSSGGSDAMVIDPGAEGNKIMSLIDSLGLDVRYIINTHGHGDHIGANAYVKERTGAKVLMHEADVRMLLPHLSGRFGSRQEGLIKLIADQTLVGGEEISCGNMKFRVLPTPGHTPGGISLATDGMVFTGDTLFKGSVGRTDFEGGSFEDLIDGITNQLFTLPDDTIVYPGHGSATTIGHEKAHNPFLT